MDERGQSEHFEPIMSPPINSAKLAISDRMDSPVCADGRLGGTRMVQFLRGQIRCNVHLVCSTGGELPVDSVFLQF